MIIRCDKCNKTTDLKSSILIQAFVLWELPIKCSKCGNPIYYKRRDANEETQSSIPIWKTRI